jgi:hypothetical protein
MYKTLNAKRAPCRIFEYYTWWYIKKLLGFERLIHNITVKTDTIKSNQTKSNQKLLLDCTEDRVCLTMAFSHLQPLCLVLQTIFIHIFYFNLLPVISYIKIMYPARLINQTLVHMLHYSPSFLLIFPITFIYHIFCLELYYINLTNKFPIHFHAKFSKIFRISLLPASNYRITYIPTYLYLELTVACMFNP